MGSRGASSKTLRSFIGTPKYAGMNINDNTVVATVGNSKIKAGEVADSLAYQAFKNVAQSTITKGQKVRVGENYEKLIRLMSKSLEKNVIKNKEVFRKLQKDEEFLGYLGDKHMDVARAFRKAKV